MSRSMRVSTEAQGSACRRGLVVAGRRADPTAPHEANLSEGHAKLLGKRVGDTIVLRSFTTREEDRCVFADDQAPDCDAVYASPGGPKIEVLVVGVVRTAIDLKNRADEISLSFLTPRSTKRAETSRTRRSSSSTSR